MRPMAQYPTPAHAHAATAIRDRYRADPDVEAVLLTNSCARGKATPDSCLDMAVLVRPDTLVIRRAALEEGWRRTEATEPVYASLRAVGAFSVIHLDFADGTFAPRPIEIDVGPDDLEVGIGNLLVYAVPLWERDDALARRRAPWLPYYDDVLRRERLGGARCSCLHHLGHIRLYTARGLYFQALARLQTAFARFLEALFISRRTYPIAYDKWIHEQVAEILDLPQLYARLPHLFEIAHFESDDLAIKARDLGALVDRYTTLGDE